MTTRSFGAIKPKPHPDQYDPAEDEEEEPATPNPDDDNGDGESEAQLRSKEAAKYRLRAKAAEEKLEKLEARLAELEKGKGEGDDSGDKDPSELEEENKELRISNAFLEEAAGRFTDLGAAYKLLDRALISFTGNNEIKGMKDAVSHVADRYPFLVVEGDKGRASEDKTQPDLAGPSGTPFNGPRKSNDGLDMAALAKKFPSLQKRLRG